MCKNRDHFYDAMAANGYFMPDKKSTFCTLKLMKEVYLGKCYFPLLHDIRLEPCLNPPSADYLVEVLANLIENNGNYDSEDQMNQYKRLVKHLRHNKPDKQWLLAVLSTLQPHNEIFQKGYRPPTK